MTFNFLEELYFYLFLVGERKKKKHILSLSLVFKERVFIGKKNLFIYLIATTFG